MSDTDPIAAATRRLAQNPRDVLALIDRAEAFMARHEAAAARRATVTSPGPGSGVGTSSRRSRSGPPGSCRTIAFIGNTSLVKSCLS